MKKIYTLIMVAVCLSSTVAMAQDSNSDLGDSQTSSIKSFQFDYNTPGEQCPESKPFKPYRHKPNTPKKWKWHEGYFSGINLFYNGLTGITPNSTAYMQLSSKSIGVDINLIDLVIVSHRSFALVTGLGLESNNFRFQKNVSITTDQDGFVAPDYTWDNQGVTLTKSKLNTTYLNLPLMVQFRFKGLTNRPQGWISAGVVGGLRIQSYTKVKSPQIGKRKNFDNFNLQNFHYGFMFSAGYSNLSINAKYYPHSIFMKDFGPHLEQFNVGIGLTF